MKNTFQKNLVELESLIKKFGKHSSATIHDVKMEDVPYGSKEAHMDETWMAFKMEGVDIMLFVDGDFKAEVARRKHVKEAEETLKKDLKEITL